MHNIYFLIGAARSGTTLLGEQLLSHIPKVHYLGEPDYIWQQAIGYKSDDVLTKDQATNSIKKRIKERFRRVIASNSSNIILEKTPSNCFRILFLNELFPDAKFIHLIRDGREVARSASKEWAAQKTKALDSKEIRNSSFLKKVAATISREGEFSNRFQSISDFYYLPKYGTKFINYFRRQLFGNSNIPWGPRFPGIKEVRKRFSLLETCAIQWERGVVAAESSLHQIEEDRILRLHYEEFLEESHTHLEEICEFMAIPAEASLLEKLSSKVIKRDTERWKQVFTDEEKGTVHNQISFTLKNLGYEI
jgi:hypothetical protein